MMKTLMIVVLLASAALAQEVKVKTRGAGGDVKGATIVTMTRTGDGPPKVTIYENGKPVVKDVPINRLRGMPLPPAARAALERALAAQAGQAKAQPVAVPIAGDGRKYGFLGVGLAPMPEALSAHLGLERGEGAVVTYVGKNTPAEKAGIEKYDVIVKIDDQVILSDEQLRKLIGYTEPGVKVKVELIRKAKRQEITTTLGETTASPLAKSMAFPAGAWAPRRLYEAYKAPRATLPAPVPAVE
jgi:membrane-associated protease RseP (regulator of RpoE activity)